MHSYCTTFGKSVMTSIILWACWIYGLNSIGNTIEMCYWYRNCYQWCSILGDIFVYQQSNARAELCAHWARIVACCVWWPTVLWCCWLAVMKGIWPIKIWVLSCWHGYLLERSANSLRIFQLIPLPPHHVWFSKIQNGLSFWYRLTWVVPVIGL